MKVTIPLCPEEHVCGCFTKRKRADNDDLPSRTRWVLFGFAVLHNALLGGVLFGWASIDHTLLEAPVDNGGAGLTLDDTARIFSWASGLSMFSPFLMGMVLDHHGPRLAAMVASILVSVGSLVFGHTTSFWGFASAALLISLGGPGVASCIIHISNLFAGNENLAMATLSGSVAISFSVFAVFDDLWSRWHMTVPVLFKLYAGIACLLAIGSLVLYPDEPFEEQPVVQDDGDEDEEDRLPSEEQELLPDMSMPHPLLTVHEGKEGDSLRPLSLHQDSRHPTPHHHHIDSIMSTSSLHIEQPLDSYLRDERKLYTRSESFFAAKKAWEVNNQELVKAVGMKDQPFWTQLWSADFLRATLVFCFTSFATNFYVASISTEMADRQRYNAETQHELARSFTVIMSSGALVSIPIGWLIDQIGVEACTFLTLLMGQLQMLLLLFGEDNIHCVTVSFWVYTLFRQFLYPVYISSLTSRLGFKYFGVLLGIGFGLGGMAQLFLYPLDALVQGDCRLQDETILIEGPADQCDSGFWRELHVIQALILLVLWVVPLLDHQEKMRREQKIKEILSRRTSTLYGTGSD